MTQLLDALKGYITPELISQTASHLGERESSVSDGIMGTLQSLLGGMASKSGDSSTMSSLFSLIQHQGDAHTLNHIGDQLTQDNSGLVNQLLPMLFGNKAHGIVESIASFAGLNGRSAGSLLGMVSPMLMGYLSKLIGDQGLNASGFASMLGREKKSLLSAVPAGLGSSLGLSGLANNVGDHVSHAAHETKEAAKRGTRWVLPLLLLLGIVAAAVYLLSGSGEKVKETVSTATEHVGDAAEHAVDATTDAVSDGVETIGDAVADLGAFFKRKLANGVELNIPENGVENKLVAFIEDEDKEIDKTTWFNFDRLTFETGKTTLNMDQSAEQLNNIAAIMEAYPAAKIKIGGYTDNTGTEAVNMQISQARAESVMKALQGLGVAADRMEAEGYGPQHPVASNDTEAGRAQNRRIALRFTAK